MDQTNPIHFKFNSLYENKSPIFPFEKVSNTNIIQLHTFSYDIKVSCNNEHINNLIFRQI